MRALFRNLALASTAALGAIAVSGPTAAQAQTAAKGPTFRTRTFGAGTALGGGVSYNVIPTYDPPRVALGPQLNLFSLELRFFFPTGHSIDVYSHIGNTIVSSILISTAGGPSEPGTLVFGNVGILYNLNPGGRTNRWHGLVAFGLEFAGDTGFGGMFETTRPQKLALRVVGRFGAEMRVGDRGDWGVQFMARPFFEPLGYARNNGHEVYTVGGGVLVEAALIRY